MLVAGRHVAVAVLPGGDCRRVFTLANVLRGQLDRGAPDLDAHGLHGHRVGAVNGVAGNGGIGQGGQQECEGGEGANLHGGPSLSMAGHGRAVRVQAGAAASLGMHSRHFRRDLAATCGASLGSMGQQFVDLCRVKACSSMNFP
ncbi:hypothetical protein D3C78_1441170 [compost metagenome]